MNTELCPECGAMTGGRAACQTLFDQLGFQATEDFRIGAIHDLAFDTYCMQHVETYCVSAKSYVAHLTRLCVGIEYDGNPVIYAALQRWYNSTLVKPPILMQRGTICITDVQAIIEINAKIAKVRDWARQVWEVYSSQQVLARAWVEEALSATHPPNKH